MIRPLSKIVASALIALAASAASAADPVRIFIGTYTEGSKSKGIYTCTFDAETGSLSTPELAGETVNPSFVAQHPTKMLLYAVNETAKFGDLDEGSLSAFRIDENTGKLSFLNQVRSMGTQPCHISVDHEGLHVLAANYGTGSLVCQKVTPDGSLGENAQFVMDSGSGPNKQRQEGAHAHCVRLHPNGQWALLADLGIDQVRAFRYVGATGKLTVVSPPIETQPGAGPRHLAYHPTKPFIYVNGELDSTINAFRFDPEKGTHEAIGSHSTLPEGGHTGNSTAETVIHPSGNFVYVSNRGHDSIAMFAIDQETGKLTPLGQQPTGGKTPRNFNIDPSGKWLLAANQESNTITLLAVDQETGKLSPARHHVEVPAPVCVMFARSAPE